MGAFTMKMLRNQLSPEELMGWHLQTNFRQPVPISMVPSCIEAIEAYWQDDLYKEITLPEGVQFRGFPTARAGDIILEHHLEEIGFLQEDFFVSGFVLQ